MAERGEMEEVPENLLCPICQDVFEKATLLACGHTFCQACLKELHKTHKQKNHMVCPMCRDITALPKHNVDTLPRNVIVNSLVEDFKTKKIGLTQQQQESDDDDGDDDSIYSGCAVKFELIRVQEPLIVLREIDLPAGMRGMAALSRDTVAIGYGSDKDGAESFSTTGQRTQFLDSTVGLVRDLATLRDDSIVVSHGTDFIQVYNEEGFPLDAHFVCSRDSAHQYKIFCDKFDNIYAVNKTHEIFIFKRGVEKPQRVFGTGNYKPWQICATSKGAMITSSYDKPRRNSSTVTLYDRNGRVGSSIEAKETNEFVYATVDSEDRVYVAHINPSSGSFRLSIYTVQGLHLIERVRFRALFLSPCKSVWYYMVSLTPRVLALASLERKLYFFKLPIIPSYI